MANTKGSAYDRLIISATKLFALQGFAATTTRDIIEDAHSSLSSIQIHFQTKENLYRKVLERALNVYKIQNEKVLKQTYNFLEKEKKDVDSAKKYLVLLTDQIVEWSFQKEWRYEILLIHREFIFPGKMFQSFKKDIDSIFELYYGLIKCISEEKDDLRCRILSYSTAMCIFDQVNYPVAQGKWLQRDLDDYDTIEQVKKIIKEQLVSFALNTI